MPTSSTLDLILSLLALLLWSLAILVPIIRVPKNFRKVDGSFPRLLCRFLLEMTLIAILAATVSIIYFKENDAYTMTDEYFLQKAKNEIKYEKNAREDKAKEDFQRHKIDSIKVLLLKQETKTPESGKDTCVTNRHACE